MSIIALCLVLGVLVLILVKVRAVRFGGALLCVAFGLALGATPVGGFLTDNLQTLGTWVMTQLRAV